MNSAYEQGFNAYGGGVERARCPYDVGFSRKEWLRGWNAACYEIGDLG